MEKKNSTGINIEGGGRHFVYGNEIVGYDTGVNIKDSTHNEVASNLILSEEVALLYEDLTNVIAASEITEEQKKTISQAIGDMRQATGKPSFGQKYKDFMATLADHMTVLGPVISPFLPRLASML